MNEKANSNGLLLDIQDLSVEFRIPQGKVYAVNNVNMSLPKGHSLGVVGESGSGKTVTMMSILGLIAANGDITSGEALFNGQDLLQMQRSELEKIRGAEVGIIFQDPLSSLNPIMKIGAQITEGMRLRGVSAGEAKERAISLLERVGIPEAAKRFGSYPFEFSGGMRQRVMIAIALANRPQLVIADEPTTALDVTIQAQVLSLLDELRQELDMSLILITHDLGVSTNICDRTVVMYGSRVMETSPTDSFVNDPWHPYSVGLMGSTLEITNVDRPLTPIPGQSPSAMDMPSGCPFHPRCFWALEHVNVSSGSTHPCVADVPQPREVAPNHLAACHFAEEVHEYVSTND